jgi:hypothetical protein
MQEVGPLGLENLISRNKISVTLGGLHSMLLETSGFNGRNLTYGAARLINEGRIIARKAVTASCYSQIFK